MVYFQVCGLQSEWRLLDFTKVLLIIMKPREVCLTELNESKYWTRIHQEATSTAQMNDNVVDNDNVSCSAAAGRVNNQLLPTRLAYRRKRWWNINVVFAACSLCPQVDKQKLSYCSFKGKFSVYCAAWHLYFFYFTSLVQLNNTFLVSLKSIWVL